MSLAAITEHAGILELSSGSALYWLRGHLWIGAHPYALVTNAAGEFELAQVPAGTYELVCWAPSWHISWRNSPASHLRHGLASDRRTPTRPAGK